MAKTTTRTMTAEHKAALAEGRTEGRAVKNYLEALQQNRPRRGRRRTPESITKRLAAIDTAYAEGSALQQLQLVQERMDLAEGARGDGHQGRPDRARGRLREDRGEVRRAQGHLVRGVAGARACPPTC